MLDINNQQAMKQSDQSFNAQQKALDRASNEKIGRMKADSADKKTSKLEIGAIGQIQNYDTQLVAGDMLMNAFKSVKPNLMNRFSTIEEFSRMTDPEKQGFATQVQQFSDAYRKAITGMSATDQELLRIEKNLPNVGDAPQQFESKLKTILSIGRAVRKRYIKNLELAGRDVSAFKNEQPLEASPEMREVFSAGGSAAPQNQPAAPAKPGVGGWGQFAR